MKSNQELMTADVFEAVVFTRGNSKSRRAVEAARLVLVDGGISQWSAAEAVYGDRKNQGNVCRKVREIRAAAAALREAMTQGDDVACLFYDVGMMHPGIFNAISAVSSTRQGGQMLAAAELVLVDGDTPESAALSVYGNATNKYSVKQKADRLREAAERLRAAFIAEKNIK